MSVQERISPNLDTHVEFQGTSCLFAMLHKHMFNTCPPLNEKLRFLKRNSLRNLEAGLAEWEHVEGQEDLVSIG